MAIASVRAVGLSGVLASFIVLGAGAAAAAVHDVPYSPIDLANGSVLLPDDLELEDADAILSFGAGGGKCEVTISGHAVAPVNDGGCPQLFATAEPRRLEAKLTSEAGAADLAFVPTSTGSPVRLTLQGSQIVMPAAFPASIAEVAVLGYDGPAASAKPTRWTMTPVEEGRVSLEGTTAEIAKRLAGRFRVYGVVVPDGEDGGMPTVYEFQVLSGSGPAVTTGPAPMNPDPGVDPGADPGLRLAEPYDPNDPPQGDPGDPGSLARIQALPAGTPIPPDLQCPPKKLPHDDMIIVCVDATGPSMTYRMVPEGTRLTKPNRYFYVHVVHRAQNHVSMDLGGQIGSYVPGTRGKFEVGRGGGLGFDGQVANDVVLMASARTFAPRRPGFAPLVVRLTDENRQAVVDPLILEFWVEETYAGAFRVGVAGTFFGGIEQQYSKVTRPNSQQEEISATGKNLMDIDLVLGYSPYLDSGGRGATGCENAPFCFEPYFGLGIVNADGTGGLDWFKSVHLGVEWELTNEFAIALTGNVRRVSRLSEGYAPGFPIDGDIPKDNRYVFGLGVVVNLSPSFLRIGAGGAAELLK